MVRIKKNLKNRLQNRFPLAKADSNQQKMQAKLNHCKIPAVITLMYQQN